jgi:hypothetical protein
MRIKSALWALAVGAGVALASDAATAQGMQGRMGPGMMQGSDQQTRSEGMVQSSGQQTRSEGMVQSSGQQTGERGMMRDQMGQACSA